MDYDILNQEEKNCPECLDTGFVKDRDNEYFPCGYCEKGKHLAGGIKKKISDLTITELFELIIKAVRECKRQDAEEAKVVYHEKWPSKITKE